MSVLNQDSDGQFNVLIALVRASIRFGAKQRVDLLALCGAGLSILNASRLNGTFLRWTELGLFEAPDGQTVISEPYRSRLGKDVEKAEGRLPAVLREIVFLEANNLRFWEKDGNKSADLTRGIVWMVAQDVYALDTSNFETVQQLEIAQVADTNRRVVQNDTRYNALKTWMAYLGFGREGFLFTVDPTSALADVLDMVFEAPGPITARTFLSKVNTVLPVLDRGIYRIRIEETLKDTVWSPMAEGRLSTSLSRAIERLVSVGRLAIEQRADAEDGLQLTGVNGRPWRAFTHVWRPDHDGKTK